MITEIEVLFISNCHKFLAWSKKRMVVLALTALLLTQYHVINAKRLKILHCE